MLKPGLTDTWYARVENQAPRKEACIGLEHCEGSPLRSRCCRPVLALRPSSSRPTLASLSLLPTRLIARPWLIDSHTDARLILTKYLKFHRQSCPRWLLGRVGRSIAKSRTLPRMAPRVLLTSPTALGRSPTTPRLLPRVSKTHNTQHHTGEVKVKTLASSGLGWQMPRALLSPSSTRSVRRANPSTPRHREPLRLTLLMRIAIPWSTPPLRSSSSQRSSGSCIGLCSRSTTTTCRSPSLNLSLQVSTRPSPRLFMTFLILFKACVSSWMRRPDITSQPSPHAWSSTGRGSTPSSTRPR